MTLCALCGLGVFWTSVLKPEAINYLLLKENYNYLCK